MLRAVWIGDQGTFRRTYTWATNNLRVRDDHLWAWKWGEAPGGRWGVLDRAFASDAEEDAALALLLGARAFREAQYGVDARAILSDLWERGTRVAGGRRFLLGGDTLCEGGSCRVNPSYCAPYAYRIFAASDPERDWMALVEGSYALLEEDCRLTSTHLPTDWATLRLDTGALALGTDADSRFSYDALRVPWRVALDEALFKEPRASTLLRTVLKWPRERWIRERRLPASVSRDGAPLAGYESLEMLATLGPAFLTSDPDIAETMRRRLDASLKDGLWGDRDDYYAQNWAWFGTALYARDLGVFSLK
jgi:endoglucanase